MNGKLDGNVKQEQEQDIAKKVARGQLGAVEIYWEKLEVNLTQNGLPQLQIYTTSHFYHSVGLEPLCTPATWTSD